MLEVITEVIARRQVLLSLAREFEATAAEGAYRFLDAVEDVLTRAVDAGVVRPELEPRNLAAVIAMNMATVHPADLHGADRRRYLTLLIEGLRPSATTLPPASSHGVRGFPPHTQAVTVRLKATKAIREPTCMEFFARYRRVRSVADAVQADRLSASMLRPPHRHSQDARPEAGHGLPQLPRLPEPPPLSRIRCCRGQELSDLHPGHAGHLVGVQPVRALVR